MLMEVEIKKVTSVNTCVLYIMELNIAYYEFI